MLKRSTWLALVVLAALIAWMIYIQQDKSAVKEEAKSFPTLETHRLFDVAAEGSPIDVKIEAATGATVEAGLGMGNIWELKLPFGAAADKGQVEAAITQIDSMRSLTNVSQVALSDLGLEKPAYIVTLSFTGGKTHTLEIGDQTPTASGYYVRLDQGQPMIVESKGIDGLLGLLTFLPYQETPTASPLPSTPTPVTAQGTLVPAESVTPTP
jgi:hypothetical protein